jgi:hypothetical protein
VELFEELKHVPDLQTSDPDELLSAPLPKVEDVVATGKKTNFFLKDCIRAMDEQTNEPHHHGATCGHPDEATVNPPEDSGHHRLSWQGPSWAAFVFAMAEERRAALTTIITARHHHPNTIRTALLELQKRGWIKHVLPTENIFPVSYPPLTRRLRLLSNGSDEISVWKNVILKHIIRKLAKAVQQQLATPVHPNSQDFPVKSAGARVPVLHPDSPGVSPKIKGASPAKDVKTFDEVTIEGEPELSCDEVAAIYDPTRAVFGFSDDDYKTYCITRNALAAELQRYLHEAKADPSIVNPFDFVKIVFFYTGRSNGGPVVEVLKSDGTTRPATNAEKYVSASSCHGY